MSEIVLQEYHLNDDYEWDVFIKESKNATFICSRRYLNYHKERFNEVSLVFKKNEKIIALFPATKNGDEVVSHGGVTYAGLIYSNLMHASDVLMIFQLILNFYKSHSIKKIIYKALPSAYKRYPSEEDLYALQCFGARIFRRDIASVIKLADRPKFSDSRKNTIKKAQKNQVTIEESKDVAAFHSLLVDVLKKFNVTPVHSIEELELLSKLFPDEIKFYFAFRENKLLAGVMVYDFGHIVHTQNMASSQAGRDVGALDYILAKLIVEFYNDREYLSFGISTENMGMTLNLGLNAQKEGFGGRGIVHDFYEWVL